MDCLQRFAATQRKEQRMKIMAPGQICVKLTMSAGRFATLNAAQRTTPTH